MAAPPAMERPRSRAALQIPGRGLPLLPTAAGAARPLGPLGGAVRVTGDSHARSSARILARYPYGRVTAKGSPFRRAPSVRWLDRLAQPLRRRLLDRGRRLLGPDRR